jgi:predicted transglutaminase-like cysteine proteinase
MIERAPMTGLTSAILLFSIVANGFLSGGANARSRPPHNSATPATLVETSPSLAPFQHVRFCLRYPADCRSNVMEDERIDLTIENSELLERVNRDVNVAIVPEQKNTGKYLRDAWMIGPFTGDCNDYAVTKRHQLLQSGLPARALRLAVVKTKSGSGHLVLFVATTKGDLVLDSLTEAIVPWQSTDYQWIKIQSASDARIWHDVRVSGASMSLPGRTLRMADRQSARVVSAPVVPPYRP